MAVLKIVLSVMIPFRHKVLLIAAPTNTNLGDQAQLYCTLEWIRSRYRKYAIVRIPSDSLHEGSSPYGLMALYDIAFAIIFAALKLFVSKKDIIIGHSGYFFVDHHGGWPKFLRMMTLLPHNKFIIFPQTVNFYSPYIKNIVSQGFDKNPNLTLLCRDAVSYDKARDMFPHIEIKLYPDIVTSLIGTMTFDYQRKGILFCMRRDVERYYTPEDIQALRDRFTESTEITDTTIYVSMHEMEHHREELVRHKIDDFAHYKLIITDRYHGTIFSQIASTPVIVLASADHKLVSGVNWFPKEGLSKYVHYASNLDEAYTMAEGILKDTTFKYHHSSTYFEEYWNMFH